MILHHHLRVNISFSLHRKCPAIKSAVVVSKLNLRVELRTFLRPKGYHGDITRIYSPNSSKISSSRQVDRRPFRFETVWMPRPFIRSSLNSNLSAGPPRYRCVECSHPVASLYTIYSKDNVRLTQCVSLSFLRMLTFKDKCKKFADKYIEHDFVVLFIDIILIKPQVYRHLLYNRLGTADDRLNVAPRLNSR
jgi:hypothetical protein